MEVYNGNPPATLGTNPPPEVSQPLPTQPASPPPVQADQPPAPKGKSKVLLFVIFGVVLLAIAAVAAAMLVNVNHTSSPTPTPTQETLNSQTNYEIVLKENSTAPGLKTDVFLKSGESGHETFFQTVDFVDTTNSSFAKYQNGDLYLVLLPGGKEKQNDPAWVYELWKYNLQKQGQKIYSSQSIDFEVSPDNKLVGVVSDNTLVFLADGSEPKKLPITDLFNNLSGNTYADFIGWKDNFVWLASYTGTFFGDIAKIDTSNYSVTTYDLSALEDEAEFTFNPNTEKLAYSDYPFSFQGFGGETFEESGGQVKLFVYDINTKENEQIAVSVAQKFEPKWLEDGTLEYNNPLSEGRTTKKFE